MFYRKKVFFLKFPVKQTTLKNFSVFNLKQLQMSETKNVDEQLILDDF